MYLLSLWHHPCKCSLSKIKKWNSNIITNFASLNIVHMKIIQNIFLFLAVIIFSMNLSAQDSDVMMDERDGNIYIILKFNDQWWMAQNLKYDNQDGFRCYEDDEVNCMLKGRWYTWEAAKKACPAGYRLPSDEDWKKLETFVGMSAADLDNKYNRNSGTVGKFLKSDGGLGFDAEFAGVVNPNGNDSYFTTHAYFWTSSETDAENGWARVLEKPKAGIDRQIITKTYGLSVRCMKDAEEEKEEKE